ncbi:ATP-binding protein [Candidatus Margulisiibacteriota bacterium]
MIKRELGEKIKKAAGQYPVVGVIGPRQSGKTTLVKELFKKYPYISLEKPTELEFALSDPEGFLGRFQKGGIIDEIQRAPQLFSYIQTIVDQNQKAGQFIITGSQNFGLLEKIGQTLAGRIALKELLPFSYLELKGGKIDPSKLEELLYKGGYPKIYDKKLNPSDWHSNYVKTYLERDVRTIKNIGDLSTFQRFLRMCAYRSGKILSLSSLANDCGITHNTAKAWLSVLEASYIVFLLNPYYKNYNKRLIKSPKLFFYDVGLLCYLMGISNKKNLLLHPEIGSIFETFIISEIKKMLINSGIHIDIYYWRDKLGREIDCLIDKSGQSIALEIKAGQTIAPQYFKNLNYWSKLTRAKTGSQIVIYAGSSNQKRSNATVLSWKNLERVLEVV